MQHLVRSSTTPLEQHSAFCCPSPLLRPVACGADDVSIFCAVPVPVVQRQRADLAGPVGVQHGGTPAADTRCQPAVPADRHRLDAPIPARIGIYFYRAPLFVSESASIGGSRSEQLHVYWRLPLRATPRLLAAPAQSNSTSIGGSRVRATPRLLAAPASA